MNPVIVKGLYTIFAGLLGLAGLAGWKIRDKDVESELQNARWEGQKDLLILAVELVIAIAIVAATIYYFSQTRRRETSPKIAKPRVINTDAIPEPEPEAKVVEGVVEPGAHVPETEVVEEVVDHDVHTPAAEIVDDDISEMKSVETKCPTVWELRSDLSERELDIIKDFVDNIYNKMQDAFSKAGERTHQIMIDGKRDAQNAQCKIMERASSEEGGSLSSTAIKSLSTLASAQIAKATTEKNAKKVLKASRFLGLILDLQRLKKLTYIISGLLFIRFEDGILDLLNDDSKNKNFKKIIGFFSDQLIDAIHSGRHEQTEDIHQLTSSLLEHVLKINEECAPSNRALRVLSSNDAPFVLPNGSIYIPRGKTKFETPFQRKSQMQISRRNHTLYCESYVPSFLQGIRFDAPIPQQFFLGYEQEELLREYLKVLEKPEVPNLDQAIKLAEKAQDFAKHLTQILLPSDSKSDTDDASGGHDTHGTLQAAQKGIREGHPRMIQLVARIHRSCEEIENNILPILSNKAQESGQINKSKKQKKQQKLKIKLESLTTIIIQIKQSVENYKRVLCEYHCADHTPSKKISGKEQEIRSALRDFSIFVTQQESARNATERPHVEGENLPSPH